jgi:hypothetical protein
MKLTLTCQKCHVRLATIRNPVYNPGADVVFTIELTCERCEWLNIVDLEIQDPKNFEKRSCAPRKAEVKGYP